jgi:NADH:ubiquinone oxidoreductase subunit 5 (subunit L)/multisubunit Na+/H+ antiporter MnhA subunit
MLIAVIGAITAIFSAVVSVFQYDVKKVIAYSTCSQLGYMFFACGLSTYEVAIFHLLNHAFFKALLFLGAGSIIHSIGDEQDMRRMGGLIKILPVTYFSMLLGSMAIIGFPFLAGFYSKDLILELAYSRIVIDGLFIYSLAILTAFFTAVYSIRLLIFVFFKRNFAFKTIFSHAEEKDKRMLASLLVLALAAIFVGYFFSEIAYGIGSFF